MKIRSRLLAALLMVFALNCSPLSFAGETAPVQLPSPQKDGGKPLMSALNDRSSGRSYSGEKLSMQTLSNLLWAAFGINRPDGRRTAPSAHNWQETDIYVATPDGAYLYDAKKNTLIPIVSKDIRAVTGVQSYR